MCRLTRKRFIQVKKYNIFKMNKQSKLKRLLHSDALEFLMEAHNGLSAKIVEEAGFKGIWASGLSISAQLGVRDNNEASWTQVLEVIEFMSDATTIPILLDGDTGYGNFNNMQRLVRKLEQRDIAGVCIEDKLFPKTNSFINGNAQPLADMDEFCGKIKAAKDAQRNEDFVLIARVEAFIAGWGLAEALKRAEAYAQAGADAILIHSKKRVADEVLAFKKKWDNRCPVVIVPTTYYATPTEVYQNAGFSIAIWANHLLRSSIAAMQQTAKKIVKDKSLQSIEDTVIPVSEIFRLQGAAALLEAEKQYLPKNKAQPQALFLAASRGVELGSFTAHKPKCMLEFQGKTLLGHLENTSRLIGIKDITVVRGYKKETIKLPGLQYADNDDYESTGEIASLGIGLKSLPETSGETLIGYGDVLVKRYILQLLLDAKEDLVIVVDVGSKKPDNPIRPDYVSCSAPHGKNDFYNDIYLKEIGNAIAPDEIHGLWTGLMKVSATGLKIIKKCTEALLKEEKKRKTGRMPDLINTLIKNGHRIRVMYVSGHWLDVDEIKDMVQAANF